MIYILQFERKMSHSQFYVGWTKSATTLPHRIDFHREGKGAKFTAAAAAYGIRMGVVAVIPDGDRTLERRIKNQKHTARIVDTIARTGLVFGHKANLTNPETYC
jgi:predicted GIY-YIG superfamily endonuclease